MNNNIYFNSYKKINMIELNTLPCKKRKIMVVNENMCICMTIDNIIKLIKHNTYQNILTIEKKYKSKLTCHHISPELKRIINLINIIKQEYKTNKKIDIINFLKNYKKQLKKKEDIANTSDEENIANTSDEENIANTSNEEDIANISEEEDIANTSDEDFIVNTSNDDSNEDSDEDTNDKDTFKNFYNKSSKNVKSFIDELNEMSDNNNSSKEEIINYFNNMNKDTKNNTIDMLKSINNMNKSTSPSLFRILNAPLTFNTKKNIISKLLNITNNTNESNNKMKQWLDDVMKIPFGIYKGLDINNLVNPKKIKKFLTKLHNTMNEAVWGHDDAKKDIVQIIAQQVRNPSCKSNIIGLWGPPGNGKCFAFDTMILMYNGMIKKVQDVIIGDIIMGDDSNPRNVLSLGNGVDEMYDIINDNGEKYCVNSEHILCLQIVEDSKDSKEHLTKYLSNDGIVEITVKDYLKLPTDIQSVLKGYKKSVKFSNKLIDFDPYIVGFWLGTDLLNISNIVINNLSINHYIQTELIKYNKYMINNTYDNIYNNNNKYIPCDYKINNKAIRLLLLAGIIDSNGIYNEKYNHYEITVKSKQLLDDLLYITRSVGVSSYHDMVVQELVKELEEENEEVYRIIIYGNNIEDIPILSPNKQYIPSINVQDRLLYDRLLYDIKIISKGSSYYYGFTLDGNNRFILGDFTVTHNTSIIKHGIAAVMNKPFVFISLGGATDSAFLEGHSFTYEGSIYGRIAQAIIDSKCMNPIIYFDELDKVSQTPKGEEIINLLIHLIDPVQNQLFRDKYFYDIDIDISKVTFIFSFNDPSLVNYILLDRITLIQTKHLTIEQKIYIGTNYLLRDILLDMGIKEKHIIIPNNIMTKIIDIHTYEGGVRSLKKQLYSIVRELNVANLTNTLIGGQRISFPLIYNDNLYDIHYNSISPIIHLCVHKMDGIGMVNGLWANSMGIGGILPIETVLIPNNAIMGVKATGSLGTIIKESIDVALSVAWNWLDQNNKTIWMKKWKQKPEYFHVHCPDGSTNKEGPSAGAAMSLAFYSRLTNRMIRHNVAMTGEINLRGEVTQIGGLEEKLCAAKKGGATIVLVPAENMTDMIEIQKRYSKLLDANFIVIPVKTFDEVILNALL